MTELLPDLSIQMWPEVADPEAVEFAVVWKHDPADLRRYPNLRAILSVTVGMEQFLRGGYPDVPIVRLEDEAMTGEMALFAVHWSSISSGASTCIWPRSRTGYGRCPLPPCPTPIRWGCSATGSSGGG